MPLVACKLTPQRCDFGNSERSTCLRRELAGCGEPDRGRKRQKHTEVVEGETEQVGPAKESTRSGTWDPYRTPRAPEAKRGDPCGIVIPKNFHRDQTSQELEINSWHSCRGLPTPRSLGPSPSNSSLICTGSPLWCALLNRDAARWSPKPANRDRGTTNSTLG